MKDKEYVKAFKFLTKRIRDFTNDQKARLTITFIYTFKYELRPHIMYWCNGHYWYFFDNHGRISCGNLIVDPHITHFSYAQHYSIGHRMKGFEKEDFIKIWLDNAINNTLYIGNSNIDDIVKLLDSNDTVESLCVQYDMTRI